MLEKGFTRHSKWQHEFQVSQIMQEVLSLKLKKRFLMTNWIVMGGGGGGGGAHPLLPLIAAKSQKRQRHSAATVAFNDVSGNISKGKPQMI